MESNQSYTVLAYSIPFERYAHIRIACFSEDSRVDVQRTIQKANDMGILRQVYEEKSSEWARILYERLHMKRLSQPTMEEVLLEIREVAERVTLLSRLDTDTHPE